MTTPVDTLHPDVLSELDSPMIATAGYLLSAILDEPADDLPRLAYADHLDETGQPDHAEFIRMQLTLDTAPLVYEVRGHAPRGERIFSGGHAFDEVWLKRFLVNHMHHMPSIDGWYTFTRGFISSVKLPQAAWLEHGPAIVRQWPIERVELSDKQPSTDQGFREPDGQPYLAFWHNATLLPVDSTSPATILSEKLIEILHRGGFHGQHPMMRQWFWGEQEAINALSSACLLFARQPA